MRDFFSMNQRGILFTLLGAICFSAKAIMVKLAYLQYDASTMELLGLRYFFSLPIFLVIALWRYKNGKFISLKIKEWAILLLSAFLGYYMASWLDFQGLQYVSAGIERVILFTYPTLVVLFSRLFFKKAISRTSIWALVLCYGGIFIIAAEPKFFAGENVIVGGVLVFLSAVTYALYLVFSGELSSRLGSINTNTLGMIFSSLFVFIHVAFTPAISWGNLDPGVYYYGLGIALISTVIPTFLMMEGIRLLGANKASIIGSIGPVSTLIMGYFFLNERFTLQELAGSILVMIGVFLIGKK
jgi:drug/metabolite transporter (DMT)-like permease